jgi:hypothetical protein
MLSQKRFLIVQGVQTGKHALNRKRKSGAMGDDMQNLKSAAQKVYDLNRWQPRIFNNGDPITHLDRRAMVEEFRERATPELILELFETEYKLRAELAACKAELAEAKEQLHLSNIDQLNTEAQLNLLLDFAKIVRDCPPETLHLMPLAAQAAIAESEG